MTAAGSRGGATDAELQRIIGVEAGEAVETLAQALREGADEARPVLVLNGPNLGRLGTREPEVYGSTTYQELVELCIGWGRALGLAVDMRQSDSEADLIGWLHEAADESLPVVINPGGYAHTSIALRDAAASRTADLIEVHISNVHAREEFRHHSYLSAVSSGQVVGLGVDGYRLALDWIARRA
jgi:3-dehydroquinate dehydratase-2